MAEKLDDLNLPQASVLKIVKDAIPDNMQIGKDVKSAMAKAASMFILYITSQAMHGPYSQKRKTVTEKAIFTALEEAEFTEFTETLTEAVKVFKEGKSQKKNKKDDVEDDVQEEEVEEVDEEDS